MSAYAIHLNNMCVFVKDICMLFGTSVFASRVIDYILLVM